MLNLPDLPTTQSTSITTSATPKITSTVKSRFESIPTDYKFISPTSARESTNYLPASPTAKFANLSQFLGGGQYTQDSAQPNLLEKSKAVYSPDLNDELAGGPLFRNKVQIDHTIPLWLGGTDTPENKVALPLAIHDIKTKQNAVVEALYYAGKIDLPEARVLAINWQNKDITGINPNPNTGQISLTVAEKKYKEWQKPTEIGIGDVLKTWGKNLGSALTLGAYKGEPSKTDLGEQIYAESLKTGPQNVLGQFAQGVASGATLGTIPSEMTPNEDISKTIARGTGQLVGTLASFSWLGKLVSTAGKAIFGIKKIQTIKGVEEVSKLPVWLEKIEKTGIAGLKGTTAVKAIENAGLFTLHGQLSKQEENNFNGRVKRFLSDATFGGMLAIPGQTLKGYAGLATGTYILSALEGATPGEAMMNTAIVVGLHGTSGINKIADNIANKKAIATRIKWGLSPELPTGEKTIDVQRNENRIATNNIFKNVESPEEASRAIEEIILANRQLYKNTLNPEQKIIEDVKDAKSLVQHTNKLTEGQIDGVPEDVTTIFNTLKNKELSSGVLSPVESLTGFSPETNLFAGTGFAKQVDTIKNKNLIDYYTNGGKPGDTIIARWVTDPKEVEFYRLKSESLPPEQQFNPETVVNIYGNAGDTNYLLARVPTKNRLNRPRDGIRASLESSGLTLDMIPNENMHNETLISWMKERGLNMVTGKVKFITPEATRSSEPFISFSITPENWNQSSTLKNIFNKKTSNKISKSIIRRLQSTPGTTTPEIKPIDTEKGTILNTITQKYPESDQFGIIMDGYRDLLSEKDPIIFKQRLNNEYGKIVDIKTAEKMISEADKVTVGDVMNFLFKQKANHQLTKIGNIAYDMAYNSDFYLKLSPKDKNFIDSLKITAEGPKPIDYEKTGQIKQKISAESPQKITAETLPSKGQVSIPLSSKTSRYTNLTKNIIEVNPTTTVKTNIPVKQTVITDFINQPIIDKPLNKNITSTVKTTKLQRTLKVDDKVMTEQEIRAKFKEVKATGDKKNINKWADLLDKVEKEPSSAIVNKNKIKYLEIPSSQLIKDRIKEAGNKNQPQLVADYKKLLETINNTLLKKEQINKELSNQELQQQLSKIESDRMNISGGKGQPLLTSEDIYRNILGDNQIGNLGEIESETTPNLLFRNAVKNNVIEKVDGIYKYNEKKLGKNTKEAVKYIKSNQDILLQLHSDVMKNTSGWKFPENYSNYYKINDIFDKTIESLKKEKPIDTWEKTINDKKIKWWTDFVNTMKNKDENFRQRSIPTKLLENFYQNEMINKGDMSFKLNTDRMTWEIEKMIKNKQYHLLPESIKKIVEEEVGKNKNVKFIVGSKKTYPGFYNITEDIRNFIINNQGEREFGRPTLTDAEKNSMAKTLGISGATLAEYMSNIGSADIQMPIVHNMLYKAFGPTENLWQLTDKQIKSSAENAAQMMASIIKFKK